MTRVYRIDMKNDISSGRSGEEMLCVFVVSITTLGCLPLLRYTPTTCCQRSQRLQLQINIVKDALILFQQRNETHDTKVWSDQKRY